MPKFIWKNDPTEYIQSIEARYNCPDGGALFFWAAKAVDSLHYLDDLDRSFEASPNPVGGHPSDVAEIAHARWATSTCITAVDLCAAALGRIFCDHDRNRELDLVQFVPDESNSKRWAEEIAARRSKLPADAKRWVDEVASDGEYNFVKMARNALVHSRLARHFTMGTAGPYIRIKLQVDGNKVSVRDIVEAARNVATRHVVGIFERFPRL